MNPQLEKDLKDTMNIISANWKMQNDSFDRSTNFIYRMNSLNDCMIEIERKQVDRDYALHRWYNYMTSIYCEYIFCDYGAVREKDKYNHDVDIYIDGIPFDVKLTVYPAKLSTRPYDLKTRSGKDDMIRWYYANQSQQSRKQMINRIYVVCDAPSAHENMVMKSNFDLMRQRISTYMKNAKENGLNELVITDAGKDYRLKSDIVHLD